MSSHKNVYENSQIHNSFHTHHLENKAITIWKISGFTTKCTKKNEDYITSPTFRIPGDESDWWINLFPKGYRQIVGYISLYIHTSGRKHAFVTIECSLINATGGKSKISIGSNLMQERGLGYSNFISQKELLAKKGELLPNDELSVICIVSCLPEITDKCLYRLQAGLSPNYHGGTGITDDLANLLEDDESTNVVLRVGTQQIPAHKTVLMCRSPVFASMFEHDMLEKDSNEVLITYVEFDVLKMLVSFIYTDDISLPDVAFALELLVAADKYDIGSLKVRCADFLNDNVSASDVFQVLKVASTCNEGELVSTCMHVIESEMSTVTLMTDWISNLCDRPDVLPVIQFLLKDW